MNLQEVKDRKLTIEDNKYDNEMAHIYEDELFYEFVEAIRDGKYKTKKEIVEVATELLKVRDIKFSRWHV